MMLLSGTVLQNRYQIVHLLGQGGMGAVYLARAMALGDTTVAVKENIGSDPRQFQQEVAILAGLSHPNLPRVLDHFVESNGAQYLVMDFIAGEDLDSRLQRQGALPEAQVLIWVDQILDAVEYLHGRGVIHRDIKPANIRITPTGKAMLVDFGVAKVYQPWQSTVTGAKAVTPGFAAPEQYRGGTDQRSDIYSLGATSFALLTGSVPPDAKALESRSASLTPPHILNPALNVQTEQAILQAMAVQPSQRFQGASAMRSALQVPQIPPTVPVPRRLLKSVPQTASREGQPFSERNRLLGLALPGTIIVLCIFGALGLAWQVSNLFATPIVHIASADTRTPQATQTQIQGESITPLTMLTVSDTPTAQTTLTLTALRALTPTRTPIASTKSSLASISSTATPKQPTVPITPTPEFRTVQLRNTLLLFQDPGQVANYRLAMGSLDNNRYVRISEGELDQSSLARKIRIEAEIIAQEFKDGIIGTAQGLAQVNLYSTVTRGGRFNNDLGRIKSQISIPGRVVGTREDEDYGGRFRMSTVVFECWVAEQALRDASQ